MTTDELKKSISDFLKYDGHVFDIILRRNPNLFIDRLKSINYNNYWFEYDPENIVFIGEPIIHEKRSDDGEFFYEYISDFKFEGYLCYSDFRSQKKMPYNLTATIRGFENSSIRNSYNRTKLFEIWDFNQKLINLIYFNANKKLAKLDLISYDYSLYIQTSSKIDKNSDNKNKQSYVTSYFYMQELIECYERIKYLLSIVLLNYNYSNKYTDKKVDLPDDYGSDKYMFDMSSFKIYDRYYLMYSELTIESFYKFWERVSFYLFQFFKPNSNELNDKNLSLCKLIKELDKEYSSNSLLQNKYFEWFVDFVLPKNSDFNKLLAYRHPFIHYKINLSNKGTGSLITSVLNNWNEYMFDDSKMNLLENENKKIKDFLIEHLNLCKIGYENMIELIKLLPNKQ